MTNMNFALVLRQDLAIEPKLGLNLQSSCCLGFLRLQVDTWYMFKGNTHSQPDGWRKMLTWFAWRVRGFTQVNVFNFLI